MNNTASENGNFSGTLPLVFWKKIDTTKTDASSHKFLRLLHAANVHLFKCLLFVVSGYHVAT